MSSSIPAISLSTFYFFYFAGLGGFMPYMGLYLRQLGLTPEAIGQLLGFLMIARVIAPNFWGYLADRTGQRLMLVRLGALLLMLFCVGLFFSAGFWPLAFVLLGYSFSQSAIQAQFEAVTIAHLGVHREQYSRIRLWGSVGFIVTGGLLGTLFDYVSVKWLPLFLLLAAAGNLAASMSVPNIATGTRANVAERFLDILRRPNVVAFLVVHFLLQFSHAPYYSFYSIYLEEYDYSRTAIGWLWSFAVLAEVVAFARMHHWLPRFGEKKVMMVSVLVSALRWVIIGIGVESPVLIWSAQLLHAASFAIFHAAAIGFIFREFGEGHQGQGQGIYAMLWGVGVALGSWGAGFIWEYHAASAFYMAALACVIAALVLQQKFTESA